MRNLPTWVLFVLIALVATPAAATVVPETKCAAAKIGAAAKSGDGKAGCTVKAALGSVATDPTCLVKADLRLERSFLTAEGKGGCAATGNAWYVGGILDGITTFAEDRLGDDGSSASLKCAAARRKAAGKLFSAALGCHSKGVLKGSTTQEINVCIFGALGKFSDAFARPAAAGGCATLADEVETANSVIAIANAVVAGVSESPAVPSPTPTPTPTPGSASFASDVQPIFTARCSGCHGSVGPSEDLDLTSGHAWANLVNVASSECTSTKLVEPSSAATSYLVKKIEGSGSCLSGSRMPLGGPYLSSTQIQAIRAWIDQGALDD
ncbi:MAG: hypothetical protein WCH13_08170 [Deltaproteobacteria bacterium]